MAFTVDPPYLVLVMARVPIEERIDRWNRSSVRWDVSTWKKEQAHVFDPTLQFKAVSPDGRYAILQNEHGQIVFDLGNGKKVCAINTDGGFCFSWDGSTFVSYDGKRVSRWDVQSGKELKAAL